MSNEKDIDIEYQYEIVPYPSYAFECVKGTRNKADAEQREKVKKFQQRMTDLSRERYRLHSFKESGLGSDATLIFERRIPTDWTKQQLNEEEWIRYRQGTGPRPKVFYKHGNWMNVRPLTKKEAAQFEFDPERDLDQLLDEEPF